MEKLFDFFEKITKNRRFNSKMSILFTVFAVSLVICSLILWTNTSGIVTIMLSLAILSTSIALFWLVFDKIHYYKDALSEAEEYIEKLENENKDYKVNTDVLLNDPEIKRIMQGRIARMPKD